MPSVILRSKNGLCVDFHGLNNGDKVQVWACHGGNNQAFNTMLRTDSVWQIQGTKKCLDVHGPQYWAKANGAYIQQWDCGSQDNQKWTYDQKTKALISKNGLCLDLHGPDYDSKRNGGRLQLWTCTGGINQQFDAAPAPQHAMAPFAPLVDDAGSMYLMYALCALLLINIVCMIVACFKNKGAASRRKYKVVSMDSEVDELVV